MLIITVICPIFAIIALGFFAEKYKMLGENSSIVLTRFVYYFSLPALLFVIIAQEPINKIINIPFVSAFFITQCIVYFSGFAISYLFKFKPRDLSTSGIRSLLMASPNTAYMGIPLILGILGKKALLPAALATILLMILTMFPVFIIETTKNKKGGIGIIGVTDNKKIIGVEVNDSTQKKMAAFKNFFDPIADLDIKYINIPNSSKKVITIHCDHKKEDIPYTFKGRAYIKNESTV